MAAALPSDDLDRSKSKSGTGSFDTPLDFLQVSLTDSII